MNKYRNNTYSADRITKIELLHYEEVCLKGYEFGCFECKYCDQKYSKYCVKSKQK